jgi:tRNA(fMet)-specific endonuclease VapC
MVDKALLDTDIFSEILKGIDQNVVAHATAYRAALGHYTISVITVMEIVKGLHKLPAILILSFRGAWIAGQQL